MDAKKHFGAFLGAFWGLFWAFFLALFRALLLWALFCVSFFGDLFFGALFWAFFSLYSPFFHFIRRFFSVLCVCVSVSVCARARVLCVCVCVWVLGGRFLGGGGFFGHPFFVPFFSFSAPFCFFLGPFFGPFCFGGLFLLPFPFLGPFLGRFSGPFFFGGGGGGAFFSGVFCSYSVCILGLVDLSKARNQEALHRHWLLTTADTESDQDKGGEAQVSHRLLPEKALRRPQDQTHNYTPNCAK